MKITISWLTIVSFVINLGLSGLSVYQFLESKKQEETLQMVVRSWQNQAEGLSNSLSSLAFEANKFSSKEDMAQAISVASSYAYSLNMALAQQRFYSDEEIKLQKEKSAKDIQNLFVNYKQSSTNSSILK